ncbi:unnamed protein product [Ectocarpus sp. 6 AP-2014]
MSRVGLVTTFRFVPFVPHDGGQEAIDRFERCWSTLESFLLFHLAKGIEHVFLYADANDGSNDPYIERVAANFNPSQVTIDVRNESQRKRQQDRCRLWGELGSFSATEVPARQSLNAEDALQRASTMGLDWLLHLDIDELFFTSEPSVQPHFDRLNELGVEQMTYANHEAVPLREEVTDYFREVRTFKVNHLLLPLSHEVAERTRFWRRRTNHGQYMLAYDNGKSAVRVLPDRVVPQSVHRWRTLKPGERGARCSSNAAGEEETDDKSFLPVDAHKLEGPGEGTGEGVAAASTAGSAGDETCEGGLQTQCEDEGGGVPAASTSPSLSGSGTDHLVNRVAMADPRELRFDEVLECNDPCVLHYPSCGLGWLRDKYRLLGSFPSSWFDGKLPIAPCFHLDARNAVHQGHGTRRSLGEVGGVCDSAERDGGRALYRKEVMLCLKEHPDEMQAQLEHGVLRILGEPASVIEQVRHVRGPPGSEITPATLLSTPQEGTQTGKVTETGGSSPAPEGSSVAEGAAEGNPSTVPLSVAAALLEGVQPPVAASVGNTASAEGVDASGVDNAWILAACAREFL